jgi:hypothetical protein
MTKPTEDVFEEDEDADLDTTGLASPKMNERLGEN